MNNLPPGIDVERLPGPARGGYPAGFFRDETVWSPSKAHFASAYTIAEVGMCNDVGCLMWGTMRSNGAHVIATPGGFRACCWQSPFCRWLSDDVFVCKAQHRCSKGTLVPLVAFHVDQGYWVIPGSYSADVWIAEITSVEGPFAPLHPGRLLKDIERLA